MNRIYCYVGLLIIVISAGCNYDIVTSKRLKELDYRCIYVAPIDSEEPQIGQVIKDVIEKEFMRKKVKLFQSKRLASDNGLGESWKCSTSDDYALKGFNGSPVHIS